MASSCSVSNGRAGDVRGRRPPRPRAQQWTGSCIVGQVGVSRTPEGSDNVAVFARPRRRRENITTAPARMRSRRLARAPAPTRLPAGGASQDVTASTSAVAPATTGRWAASRLACLGELGLPDHVDSVSAFSTTPAFHTFRASSTGSADSTRAQAWRRERMMIYGPGGAACASSIVAHHVRHRRLQHRRWKSRKTSRWATSLAAGSTSSSAIGKRSAGAQDLGPAPSR